MTEHRQDVLSRPSCEQIGRATHGGVVGGCLVSPLASLARQPEQVAAQYQLNVWRNAIAHQEFGRLAGDPLTAGAYPNLRPSAPGAVPEPARHRASTARCGLRSPTSPARRPGDSPSRSVTVVTMTERPAFHVRERALLQYGREDVEVVVDSGPMDLNKRHLIRVQMIVPSSDAYELEVADADLKVTDAAA